MTFITDIYPRTAYESVIVHGPKGAGKTNNREALGQFFGLQKFADDCRFGSLFKLEPGALYLTNGGIEDLVIDTAGMNVLVISFDRAMRAMEAKAQQDEADRDPVTGMTPDEIARSLSNKDTNPKDAVGIAKVPQSVVSRLVLGELGLAMFEGARKYGRHNYRVAGVRASVYFDAVNRHMDAWWEGEDLDPDSGLSHVTKAIATLVVLRDAMLQEKFTDDRPPPAKDKGWMAKLNELAAALIKKYPDPKPAITRDHKE